MSFFKNKYKIIAPQITKQEIKKELKHEVKKQEEKYEVKQEKRGNSTLAKCIETNNAINNSAFKPSKIQIINNQADYVMFNPILTTASPRIKNVIGSKDFQDNKDNKDNKDKKNVKDYREYKEVKDDKYFLPTSPNDKTPLKFNYLKDFQNLSALSGLSLLNHGSVNTIKSLNNSLNYFNKYFTPINNKYDQEKSKQNSVNKNAKEKRDLKKQLLKHIDTK